MESPLVWLPLCLLFVAPFFDPRRPARIVHVDLLVLLCFGGYPVMFNGAPLGVPLAYPVLAYVLARLLYAGARARKSDEPLVPYAPFWLLAVALVALIGLRIGVNLSESYVIDTGRSGLVGAERILDGESLYQPGPHVDTYGPLNYVAFLPFALIFGVEPTNPDPAAAHAAAIAFDLLAIGGLLLLGTRLLGGSAGRRFGVVLAYAWAAYPYTLFVLGVNTNDALFAAFLILALALVASPARRGAALAAGAAMKLGSLPLVPLFATRPGRRSRRPSLSFGAAFALVFVLAFLAFLPDGGPREVYDRTLGFQFGAETQFSAWEPRPAAVQALLQLAAFGLAVAVAFVPRHRNAMQVAALAGAVLVAIQLAAAHWYYFYVVWFAPFAFVAIFGGYRLTPGSSGPERLAERPSNATATNGNAQGRYAQVQ